MVQAFIEEVTGMFEPFSPLDSAQHDEALKK